MANGLVVVLEASSLSTGQPDGVRGPVQKIGNFVAEQIVGIEFPEKIESKVFLGPPKNALFFIAILIKT
jgi:hypothetical protein